MLDVTRSGAMSNEQMHYDRILITGANGDIGRAIAPHLSERHELTLGVFDLGRPEREAFVPPPSAKVVRFDIADAAATTRAFTGIDAVIHLAGQRSPQASFDQLLGPNIVGVYNVFEAAVASGVRRVIFASSNHATGGYDLNERWPLRADQPVWPDSYYGVTKAFGEELGRYYFDTHGLSVVCLRIGWAVPRPTREVGLRMWLSPADTCRLMDCCLAASVGYGIYYGVSANTRCKWDMTRAREELGYVPHDDAEIYAAEIEHIP